jgi:hypothetical protein
MPTFDAISHEQHAQIVNHKPYPLYSILHFTYQNKNIINTQRIDTTLLAR